MRISDWSSDVCSSDLDADTPPRPDGYYGISKAFGENLSRFYYDRYGIETVCLRIGSSFPEARDRRMLVTWLSYDDLTDLVARSLFTPGVGHAIIYGASANRDSWWDNHLAARLGFAPKASSRSEEHTSELQSLMRISYAVFCLKKKNTDNRRTR